MRAMRARGVNGYGDLKLVNLLLSARETSDRFVQRPRLADPERKTIWATYRLVLVVGWIGLMKFTEHEANGIQPLVAHSPFAGGCTTF